MEDVEHLLSSKEGPFLQKNPKKKHEDLLKKLSVDLLKTYNLINQRYYAARKKKKQIQKTKGYDDENFDYIVKVGELLDNRYTVETVLGKGSFGRVVRAKDETTGERVAVKIVKNKRAFRKQAQTEIRILNALIAGDPLDAQNIVRLKSTFMHFGHQCLVFELLSMNLYQLLRDTKFHGVSLHIVRKFGLQLLKTLLYIQKVGPEGVIHCDLKPENVLLRHPKHSAIKVIDFGSACFGNEKIYTYIQSRFYRAPEILLGCQYSCSIDMWSLGCILVEMHTGKPVFDGSNAHEQMALQVSMLGFPPIKMLLKGEKTKEYFSFNHNDGSWRLRKGNLPNEAFVARSLRKMIGVDTHGPRGTRKREKEGHTVKDYMNFLDLVIRMLTYDPEKRITPSEALKHKFFVSFADNGSQTSSGNVNSSEPLIMRAFLGDPNKFFQRKQQEKEVKMQETIDHQATATSKKVHEFISLEGIRSCHVSSQTGTPDSNSIESASKTIVSGFQE